MYWFGLAVGNRTCRHLHKHQHLGPTNTFKLSFKHSPTHENTHKTHMYIYTYTHAPPHSLYIHTNAYLGKLRCSPAGCQCHDSLGPMDRAWEGVDSCRVMLLQRRHHCRHLQGAQSRTYLFLSSFSGPVQHQELSHTVTIY